MLFDKLRKKKTYTMDIKLADETLQNVFAACEQPPNTIPFDKLILRQKLNTKSYSIRMWISLAILILTFFAPLLLKSSTFKITYPEHVSCDINLIEHHVQDNLLFLTVSGDTVDYERIYMETANADVYSPISYDAESGVIILPYPKGECNIYIPDHSGNTLHLLISPK